MNKISVGPALAHRRPCSEWCIAKKYRWIIYIESRRRSAEQRAPTAREDEGAEGVEFVGRVSPQPTRGSWGAS